MPYSQSLAERVRRLVDQHRNITERRMFGCVCFMMNGNMLVGIWKSSLIVRLGPEQAAKTIRQDDVRAFDLTGRPMKGWIIVEPDGLDSDQQLARWIDRAMLFVQTLPAK